MRMAFVENGPKVPPKPSFSLSQKFTEENAGMLDFLRNSREPGSVQRGAMIHTPVIGACTKCKLAGSVDVPVNMNFKTADNMLEGRIVKVLCPRCRKETEFRPLTPEELTEDQFFIMRRYYEIYKAEKVAGRVVPEHVAQFVQEYENRLKHALNRKGLPALPVSQVPVPESESRPKIIIPE